MQEWVKRGWAAALVVGFALWGCGCRSPKYVRGDVRGFPRLEYADEQVSVNDRCPVRKVKLNLRVAPVYVNGRPVGFC